MVGACPPSLLRCPDRRACLRRMATALAWALLPALPGTAHAAAPLMIWPVDPVIAGEQRAVALWVENRGTEPVAMQARVFAWRQEEGDDRFTPQQAVVASPPISQIPRERGRWCGSSRPSPYRPGRNRPSGCCSTNCRRPRCPGHHAGRLPRQRPRPVRRATADPLRDPAVRLCPRHDGPAHARHLRGPAVRAVHGRHAGAGPALERGPRPGRQAAPRGPQHGGPAMRGSRPCAGRPRAGRGRSSRRGCSATCCRTANGAGCWTSLPREAGTACHRQRARGRPCPVPSHDTAGHRPAPPRAHGLAVLLACLPQWLSAGDLPPPPSATGVSTEAAALYLEVEVNGRPGGGSRRGPTARIAFRDRCGHAAAPARADRRARRHARGRGHPAGRFRGLRQPRAAPAHRRAGAVAADAAAGRRVAGGCGPSPGAPGC